MRDYYARRAPRYEHRGPAIRAVAARKDAVRKMQGLATHSLARMLFEENRRGRREAKDAAAARARLALVYRAIWPGP